MPIISVRYSLTCGIGGIHFCNNRPPRWAWRFVHHATAFEKVKSAYACVLQTT